LTDSGKKKIFFLKKRSFLIPYFTIKLT
jgi:hypothetical protein